MHTLPDDSPARRWPRAQRFSLSVRGRTLAAAYRKNIAQAGQHGDQGAFAAACASWAAASGLQPDDGIYLSELGAGELTLAQLRDALEICGQSVADIKRCLERLLGAGLVVAAT
jgi:hypothetical protein